MGFVNGLSLVVVELKTTGVPARAHRVEFI
jgi:hypothetical protein